MENKSHISATKGIYRVPFLISLSEKRLFKAKVLPVLICACSLGLLPGSARHFDQGTTPPGGATTFLPGEDLVYEVSWWFVRLGTIRLRIIDDGRDSNGARLRARGDIDSYAGLPFADLHVMTETVMDSECYSASFAGRTKDGDIWKTIRYNQAPERGLLFVERGRATGRDSGQASLERVDTVAVKRRFLDGVSVLYFARANVASGRKSTVTTVVEGARGRTVFEFSGERAREEIDAVNYPIDVVKFQGTAEFEGIFGLKGPFEGWFSNDEARIPIRAKLEVIVGSVKVELIKWHREGWMPPRSLSED